MQRKIILLGLVVMFSACTKPSFQPKYSTCNELERDFVDLQLTGKSYYATKAKDIVELKKMIDRCRLQKALSQQDYAKYLKMKNEIQELDKGYNHIMAGVKPIYGADIDTSKSSKNEF